MTPEEVAIGGRILMTENAIRDLWRNIYSALKQHRYNLLGGVSSGSDEVGKGTETLIVKVNEDNGFIDFDGQTFESTLDFKGYLFEREAKDKIVMLRIFLTDRYPMIWVKHGENLPIQWLKTYFPVKNGEEMRLYIDLEVKDCSLSKEHNFELLAESMKKISCLLSDNDVEVNVLHSIEDIYDYEFVKKLMIKLDYTDEFIENF